MDMIRIIVPQHRRMVSTLTRMPESLPEEIAINVLDADVVGPVRHVANVRKTRGMGPRLFLIRNSMDSLVSWYYSMYFSHASIPIVQEAIAEGVYDEAEIKRRILIARGLHIPDINTFVRQESHAGHPEPLEELNWPYLRDIISEIQPEDTVLLYEDLYEDQFVHDLLSFMDTSPTSYMIERVRGVRGSHNQPTVGILGHPSIFEHRRDGSSGQHKDVLSADTIQFLTENIPPIHMQRH